MRRRTSPLLCEFHAHTTWSDGDLSLGELVDLYGRAGFDVLAVPTTPAGQAWPLCSARPTYLARVETASVEPRAA